ncbi:hypothetical protein L7F22_005859 [Adiantum nelumboides]|nr:hypothetical protein [Adiantum nelumboides]
MDALFATIPSQSFHSCSEDMVTRCCYTKFSSLSLQAKFSSARGVLSNWGALVKLRSLPFSVRCSSSNAHRNDGYGGAPNDNNWASSKDDYKFLEAQVVEAVSLLPSQGHLFMTMASGGEVEVNHVNPPKGRLLYRTRNPTIFLKILSDRELILPIIVGDIAVGMLMKALRGEEAMARPNQYHLMRNLISSLNFEIRMVKVTERVADTYLSRIFMGKPGEEEMMSVDARPSDAINLAVRCKVPIFVNEDIVYADAVRPVHASTQGPTVLLNYSSLSNLDRPAEGRDPVAEEITLMKNMLIAVVEERYSDAARWRDELNTLRAQRRRIRQPVSFMKAFQQLAKHPKMQELLQAPTQTPRVPSRKEPQGKQFSAKDNVTTRLTVSPFKKKPFTGKEGHLANECPQRNFQDKDDKSDRKGKKPKPSAGILSAFVGDQQNMDAIQLCRAWGKVRDQEVQVFFDLGARANFISPKLAAKLGIRAEEMGMTGEAGSVSDGDGEQTKIVDEAEVMESE